MVKKNGWVDARVKPGRIKNMTIVTNLEEEFLFNRLSTGGTMTLKEILFTESLATLGTRHSLTVRPWTYIYQHNTYIFVSASGLDDGFEMIRDL